MRWGEAFHGEPDALQGDLLAHLREKADDGLGRRLGAVELKANRATRELGELLTEFTIQRERKVSVQLFLELEELLVAAIPRARLKHHKHDLARRRVLTERIQHGGIGHAVVGLVFVRGV